MNNILVTGGAGFIGSNFIPFFLNRYNQYSVVNVDKLTYAASLDYLKEVEDNSRYRFVNADINNRDFIEYIIKSSDIRGVIHFAAESHVDNSISNPDVFIKTNINGTFNLLDSVRNHWMDGPFKYKEGYEKCRFHHISTDEVYGSLGETGYFTEASPFAPNSPYSASKASGDLLVRSYYHTYGLNVVTTNCSNNYGPKQHREKFIPTIIRNALSLEPIPLYADGKNIRDWLYVMDHCKGIDLVFHDGKAGETYNIGGDNERENIEIANKVCKILDVIAEERLKNSGLDSFSQLITHVSDRPGHDRRYAIDATKIKSELKWFPEECFEAGIEETIRWYVENGKK